MIDPSSNIRGFLLSRVMAFIVISLIVLFVPAGAFSFWQGWMYLASLLLPAGMVLGYFYRRDPGFLRRRMNFSERRKAQKGIIGWGNLVILLVYLLPGFDFRWGWSEMPSWVSMAAQVLVLIGYMLIIAVFKENRFASRVVEVTEEQKLIDTGPYLIVRHPMYCGVVLFYLFTPFALGSYWAGIPALLILPVLVLRILDEEALLSKELPGYADYQQRVRYRLIPGVW